MIRLAGILTGSAVAAAFMVVALGIPDFGAEEDAASPVPGSVGPTDRSTVTETGLAVQAESGMTGIPGDNDAPLLDATAPVAPGPPADATFGESQVPDEIVSQSSPPPVAEEAAENADVEPRWYAFWSPFRSELAADGFVAELQRTTGLDYRVVKLKPGVYEVAFAYSDDADIDDRLTQISMATGLDLSGG